jgi:hypothetical protein
VRLPRQQLREQGAAEPAALRRRPNVQLDDLEMRRVEPFDPLRGGE